MFEWDEAKPAATLAARGLDFRFAITAFDGRPVVQAPAARNGEQRFVTVALLDRNHSTVVWVWRGAHRRIISFRRARSGEEKQYRAIFG